MERLKSPRFLHHHHHHHHHHREDPPPPPPPPRQHRHAWSVSTTTSSGSNGESAVSPPRRGQGAAAGPRGGEPSPTTFVPYPPPPPPPPPPPHASYLDPLQPKTHGGPLHNAEPERRSSRRKSLGLTGRPARPTLIQTHSANSVPTVTAATAAATPAERERSPNRLRKSISARRRGRSVPRLADSSSDARASAVLGPPSHEPLPKMMLPRPSTAHTAPGPPPGLGMPMLAPAQPTSPTLETITYQHIHEMASKRISTLDYLRKAHEGRVYWFNTLLFNKPDLQRMPYFEPRKLARRATNYLLLGVSLPTVLDLYASTAGEFLKTLHALLAEFEAFQQIHSADGASSLSRARIPQMFKRATATGGSRRRTSSTAEPGLLGGGGDATENGMMHGANGGSNGDSDLLPGEEYTHLLTPSLPFDPDFYETFATLCDVLIDCYTKLMTLVASPRECSPQVAELFTKADAKVRKILVQSVVKEFEDSSRAGVKSEVAGVSRVVLGGLM